MLHRVNLLIPDKTWCLLPWFLSLSLGNSLALSETVMRWVSGADWTFHSSCWSHPLSTADIIDGAGTLSAEPGQSFRLLFNFLSQIAMLAKLLCGNWPRLFLRFLPASKVHESKIIFRIWKRSSSWSHWKITTQESTMIARETWLALLRSKPIRPAFKDILDWKFASPLFCHM